MTEGETLQIQVIRGADTQERGNIPYMTSRPHPEDLFIAENDFGPVEHPMLPGVLQPLLLVCP